MKSILYSIAIILSFLTLQSCTKIVDGCTDPMASNYQASANNDDGSCIYLYLGQSFQGGVVGYFFKEGDAGYDASVLHGLIVAPATIFTDKWGCIGDSVGTATAFGTGDQNTAAIVNACADSGTAAKYCNDLVISDYSDWYLPSRDELLKLYANRTSIGGFSSSYYWTSSENSANQVICIHMNSGNALNINKDSTLKVRAIRRF
ncbi:MAG: DUF1566 domain-containing protein [Bacteroidota bacterium]